MVLAILVALRIAGLKPETLAVGGALTAVLFGLAAQQTIGNLIAGTVLLSARPFRVGDRIRLHSGATAGPIEGTVAGLGLLYTILRRGEDPIMVPNSVVLNSAVEPLREPAKVDLLARFPRDVKPSAVQELVQERISVPTIDRPHIELEEVDGEEVLMRIEATPRTDTDGPKLADEVLAAVAEDAAPPRSSVELDAGNSPVSISRSISSSISVLRDALLLRELALAEAAELDDLEHVDEVDARGDGEQRRSR